MKKDTHRIARLLEVRHGSRLIAEDNRILFTIPKSALVATLFGNPQIYKCASLLMQSAETEHRFWEMVNK